MLHYKKQEDKVMQEPKSFYYHFDKINAWFIFNMSLLIMLFYVSIKCVCLLFWWQTQVLWGVCVFSWAMWAYKYIYPQRLALVDDKSITIDHCRPLLWKDIDYAEERIVRCCFKKLKIIALVPKKGINYHYNFLQKHNGEFTPFSIPLYNIVSEADKQELQQIISQKVKYKKLK